mgnify:CR=1 FL=1
MASRAKAKGTRWESAIVAALRNFFGKRYGLDPYRPAQSGRRDVGDINGVSPFVVQAKDWASWEDAIREGLDAADAQAVNAGEMYGVALVKRARRPVGLAYAVMTLGTWARLLVRLRRAEALLEAHAPEAFERHAAETRADAERPI